MSAIPATLELFNDLPPSARKKAKPTADAVSGTFSANTKLPVHRWFRYSAGFSADWVRLVLEAHPQATRVLDPFVGSGTVLIEAEKLGRMAVGIESHPLVSRIAAAKLAWRCDAQIFRALASEIAERAAQLAPTSLVEDSKLLDKCFTPEARKELVALKMALDAHGNHDDDAWRLCWLAFLSIIRESSFVGTAQWQYVLPNRRKARVVTPIAGFLSKVAVFSRDIESMQPYVRSPAAKVAAIDARKAVAVPGGWADLVITSPPYANNYDYADATRLELSVLGEIATWGDLQGSIRPNLVRACTQHVASQAGLLEETLASAKLAPISKELAAVVRELDILKESKGGKKPYHLMLACYFFDLAEVFAQLRQQVATGGRMCFVIGDSAPYGVHAPVDRWLGELAVHAGFESFYFEKIRDRNMKWKNRKHRVPLHEGRLWIEG